MSLIDVWMGLEPSKKQEQKLRKAKEEFRESCSFVFSNGDIICNWIIVQRYVVNRSGSFKHFDIRKEYACLHSLTGTSGNFTEWDLVTLKGVDERTNKLMNGKA